jgi:2-methylcitrate dehydratase PrpD
MSFARELAQRVNRLSAESMPAEALRVARLCIADTLGPALGSTRNSAFNMSRRAV